MIILFVSLPYKYRIDKANAYISYFNYVQLSYGMPQKPP